MDTIKFEKIIENRQKKCTHKMAHSNNDGNGLFCDKCGAMWSKVEK